MSNSIKNIGEDFQISLTSSEFNRDSFPKGMKQKKKKKPAVVSIS
jgi:hypothetical protein